MVSKPYSRLTNFREWVLSAVMAAEKCGLLSYKSQTRSFILWFLFTSFHLGCVSLWTMAPFLRISFNSFELGPVQNQGEHLQPFCAIKMKEALTTGEVTNGDAFLNMSKFLRNTAILLSLRMVVSPAFPVMPSTSMLAFLSEWEK